MSKLITNKVTLSGSVLPTLERFLSHKERRTIESLLAENEKMRKALQCIANITGGAAIDTLMACQWTAREALK